MSTHAAIIQQTHNGHYRGICVHSDGYPENTGKILTEHYATEEAVDALINLGDLSVLAPAIAPAEGESHSFKSSAEGVTIAYHRDRGERLSIRSGASLPALADRIDWQHLYLWEDGAWHHFTRRTWQDFLQDQAEQAEHEAGWDKNP